MFVYVPDLLSISKFHHMMQDNYLEEAMKIRNLLEEFNGKHDLRAPTILGVREHVFTGRLLSPACQNSLFSTVLILASLSMFIILSVFHR